MFHSNFIKFKKNYKKPLGEHLREYKEQYIFKN